MSTNSAAESPHTLTIQPLPINCRVAHSQHGDSIETAIAREWTIEGASRCTCCPDRCHASVSGDNRTAMCLMVAKGYVSLEDAKLFSPARFVSGTIPDDRRGVAIAVDGVEPVRAGAKPRTRRGSPGG